MENKDEISAIKESFTEINEAFAEIKEKFSSYMQSMAEKHAQYQITIDKYIKGLEEIKEKASAEYGKIEETAIKVYVGSDKELSLDDQIVKAFETAQANTAKINALVSQTDMLHRKLIDNYRDIFGYETEKEKEISSIDAKSMEPDSYIQKDDGTYCVKEKVRIKGKNESLEEQIKSYNNMIKTNIEEFKDLLTGLRSEQEEEKNQYAEVHGKIQKEIEERLRGATAVGLAEAYDRAKEKQEKQIKAWRLVFILSMTIMVIPVVFFYHSGSYSFSKEMNTWEIFVQFLKILPVELPFIWMGLVANRKINQHTRLHEEYLHKWSVAFGFEGLRRETEGAIDQSAQHLNQLLANFIGENASNPSATLEKRTDDSPFRLLIEAFWRKREKDSKSMPEAMPLARKPEPSVDNDGG